MPVQYKLIKTVANFSNIFRGVDRLSRNLFVVGFSVVAAPRHGNDHKLVVRNPYLIDRTTSENRAPASPDTGCVSLSTIFLPIRKPAGFPEGRVGENFASFVKDFPYRHQ